MVRGVDITAGLADEASLLPEDIQEKARKSKKKKEKVHLGSMFHLLFDLYELPVEKRAKTITSTENNTTALIFSM